MEIDGVDYPIASDFRTALRVILAFEDPELTQSEKRAIFLLNLYPEGLPANVQEAAEKAKLFLDGGKSDIEPVEPGPRVYSFAKDANYIYAAFRQTHSIDLGTADLHWWTFLALFFDLGQDTTFCQLVALRKRIKSGKATKEEREMAREMGDTFDVPEIDTRTITEMEQEAEFMRLIEQGQKNKG